MLLLQLEINLAPMLAVAKAARKHGSLVMFKPSPLIPGKTVPSALELLPFVDVLFLNESEASASRHTKGPAS